MTDEDGSGQAVSGGVHGDVVTDEGFETIEAYEVGEEVVLYDSENPLAWVRTDNSVRLRDYD